MVTGAALRGLARPRETRSDRLPPDLLTGSTTAQQHDRTKHEARLHHSTKSRRQEVTDKA